MPEQDRDIVTNTLKTINDISLAILHPLVKSLGGKLSHIQGIKAREINKVISESDKFLVPDLDIKTKTSLNIHLKQVCNTFGEVNNCLDFNIHLFDPNIDRRQKNKNYNLHFKKYAIFGSVNIYFSDLLLRLESDHNYEKLNSGTFEKMFILIHSILQKLDTIIDYQAELLSRYE